MTATSDERRDVAARMRKLPSDIYPAIKEWAKDGLFVDANLSDEADYSQIHNAVLGCFPAEYMHPGDYKELHDRLADLIEPEPERTCSDVGDGSEFKCSECGCKVARHASFPDAFENPNCGAAVTLGGREAEIRHCPNCGAELVPEDEEDD
jgi:hypothetical protein